MNSTTADRWSDRCVESVRAASAEWQQFWFKPADPFTLGMIRVLTGLMLTYNLLIWGTHLDAFFGIDGLQPLSAIKALHSGSLAFTLFSYVSTEWLWVVHWGCVAVAVIFCCGAFTRISSLLAFIIAVSYSQRVPIANFGLDQILGLLCLYLAIGPSGAAMSIDAWWRKRRAAKMGQQLTVEKSAAAQMTLRLIQIHVCVIYFWAGFAKLKGDSWWTGEAMWQVMANLEYQTLDLTWMARIPWLPYLIAHVTVAWEVFFCVLVWNKKLRPLMLAIGTAMHLGIGAFLGMWTFGLIMTFPYLAFAKPSRWRRLAIWKTSQPNEPVGFAEPAPENQDDPDPDEDETQAPASAEESPLEDSEQLQPIRAESADDEIMGETDAATAPPVVIDYRRSRQQDSKSDTGPSQNDGDTQAMDDEYIVGGNADSRPPQNDQRFSETVVVETLISKEQHTDVRTEEHGHSADDPNSDLLNSGAAMSDKPSPAPEPKNEMSVSRMERIKPKSANSLTGAPQPKIDGRVEDSVLAPETEVLLVALHAPERNTFRTYLRRHDIPCRAATSTENAVSVVVNMKPAAVLLSGSCLNPEEIITLVDDLNDMVEAPVLALLTLSQIKLLSNDPLSAHILQYPASLREIREALTGILLEEGNAKPRCSLRSALSGN